MTKAKNIEFMQYYEQYHLDLSHFCNSLERNRENAKELMSETISRAFEGFNRLEDKSKFKSYLFGIAANTLKETIRKKNRTLPETRVVSISKSTSKSEEYAVNLILKEIPEKQAEVFVLFEIADISLVDISETLGVNISTVKTRLSRARMALRSLLQDEFNQHIKHY